MITAKLLGDIAARIVGFAPAKMLLEWRGMRIDVTPQNAAQKSLYSLAGMQNDSDFMVMALARDFENTYPRTGDLAILDGEAVSVASVDFDSARATIVISLARIIGG